MKKRMQTCPECHGTGYLGHFSHVANGLCFVCMGRKEIYGNIVKDGAYYGHAIFEISIFPHDDFRKTLPVKIAKVEAFSSNEAEEKVLAKMQSSTDPNARFYDRLLQWKVLEEL